MAKLKDLKYHSVVKGELVARVSVTAGGVFTAVCDGRKYDAKTLDEIRGKIAAYVDKLDAQAVVFPVIEINEEAPFGCRGGVPFVCFKFERYWLSEQGWRCTHWAEPDVKPEDQDEDELGVYSRDNIVEAGSIEAYVRSNPQCNYVDVHPDILARKFPVIIGARERSVVIAYRHETWTALQTLQDRIGELRQVLHTLFGQPDRLIQIASTWQGLALADKSGEE